MYHSEHEQDKWLNENIFKNKRGGVFFEAGAIDGLINSNSLFFERELGWTGVCVEANPAMFAALKQNRKCTCRNAALWKGPGGLEFRAISGQYVGWSCIVAACEPEHERRIDSTINAAQIKTVVVEASPLEAVLDDADIQKIDYLSLDIEGAEFDVLRPFPFWKYDIDILDIENNWNNEELRALILRSGFEQIARLGVNDIFRAASKTRQPDRLQELLTVPRVPLPADVPDDEHNRVGGLIQLRCDWLNSASRVMELGTGRGVSTEVFALTCGEVYTADIFGGEWRAAAEAVAKKYANIHQLLEKSSVCVNRFPDNHFDAVYIDAAHEYEPVREDIELWWPKVKIGGIICGHDYIDRPTYNFGVIRAVNEMLGPPDRVYCDTSWVKLKRRELR